MKQFEQPSAARDHQEKLDEIALRAADMKEFQDAVKQAKGGVTAIKAVRVLLQEHFPEINELPEAEERDIGYMSMETGEHLKLGTASNECRVAKDIVALLKK